MLRLNRAKRLCHAVAHALPILFLVICFATAAGVFLWLKIPHQRLPGPYIIYKTEPSFVPNNIRVTHYTPDRHLLEPGYIFIAPHIVGYGFGPQIVDHDGNLVWYGQPTVSVFNSYPVYAAPVFACDFMGQKMKHICYSETHPSGYETRDIREGAAHRVFDNTYREVGQEFDELGDLGATPNAHEWNMLPGGHTYVQAVSPVRQKDLSDVYGPRDGWISDGCFQEVDIYNRSVLFQWCHSDHYEPSHETYFFLDVPENKANVSSGGKGTRAQPWDYIHINAIDKNEEGDYLVSGRHLSQVLKIAGAHSRSGLPPGTTIWRLNGRNSDFKFLQEQAKFARLHHVRFLSTGREETRISLFNNAANGTYTRAKSSSGMILRLNNNTMEASLEASYKSPSRRISFAQGSTVVFSNSTGNVLVGWGARPEWSEFAPDGKLLYHAETWANDYTSGKRLTNYRALKSPWAATPYYPPKLVAYTQTCPSGNKGSAPLIAYVSWNGATEVGKWRFYISETRTGLRAWVHTADKAGFETKAEVLSANTLPRGTAWVTVEAVDKTDGQSVIGTTTARVFVPPPQWRGRCDVEGCFHESRFEYDAAVDGLRCISEPASSMFYQTVAIAVVVETLVWIFDLVFIRRRFSGKGTRSLHYSRL